MGHVNLLDWRNKHILIQNRRYALVVSIVVGLCICAGAAGNFAINVFINKVQTRLAYVNQQVIDLKYNGNDELELQNQKTMLSSNINFIHKLHASCDIATTMLDNLAHSVPEGVLLNKLARNGNELIISGTGASNYSITLFIENIRTFPWAKDTKLLEIKTNTTSDETNIAFEVYISIEHNNGL